MPFSEPLSRPRMISVAMVAATLALGLGACGRRGQPEPPPDPSAQTRPAAPAKPARSGSASGASSAQPTSGGQPATGTAAAQPEGGDGSFSGAGVFGYNLFTDDDEDSTTTPGASPQPSVSRRRGRVYTVPKEPFILDPLL